MRTALLPDCIALLALLNIVASASVQLAPNVASAPIPLTRDSLVYFQAEYNEPYIGYSLYVSFTTANATRVLICEARLTTSPQFNSSDCDHTYSFKAENNVIVPKYPFTMFGTRNGLNQRQ